MSNPAVSVVIPVYNAQDGIKQCLTSLLKQTFKNFEIILLNDGSTDESLKVLQSYSSQYSFIKVIDKENEGVAKTRNQGILLAKGEYIIFIDNDDFVNEDYIEHFYNVIHQEKKDIVLGGYKRINQNKKILFSQNLSDSEWSKYIIVAPWARIYRTSFLRENNIEFFDYPIGEDVIFSIKAYNKTDKIKIIDYNGYNWFFNESSISNTSQKGFNFKIDIIYFLNKVKEVSGDSDYTKYFIKRYYIWYLLFSGKNASSKEFVIQYNQIKNWLNKENLVTNLNPLSKEITGERFQTTISILMFEILEHLRLVPIFAKIYCKGKEQ
ncbi:glycosyltransferase [Streptococcus anginosus]|uniref:Glycosyltransferase n=1 Tax=Streptococcus anginosus TaxID=1328 RepID=A0A4U9YL44_STRAP|nr:MULTISPECIES: glycosyltransferase [Streptococcus]VEE12017.1 glycosyltransferase [Streptococcus milleri]VTS28240.1 glycosyltransferase [Streptococcus anginosus]